MGPSSESTENRFKDNYSTFSAIYTIPDHSAATQLNSSNNNNNTHPSEVSTSGDDEGDNLFRSLRGFLIFGKLIGLLPFSGVFSNSWKNLNYRKSSMTAIVTYTITLILMFNSSTYIVESLRAPKRNALDIANSIRPTWYTVWGCLIYVYFIWRGSQFLNIFKIWSSTHLSFGKKDTTLRRDTYLISGIILTSCILENAVLHFEFFKEFDKISGKKINHLDDNKTFLETYYWRAHGQWAKLFSYNWFLAVLGFFQHKCVLYTVNYLDALVAVLGRALYFRFKALCEEAEEKLLKVKKNDTNTALDASNPIDKLDWMKAASDHEKVCALVQAVQTFVSPLLFGLYALNTFYISLQLFDGLTNDPVDRGIIHSIYTPWSFIHLVMRTYIVSICCARINTYAHQFMEILHKCPTEMYTTEISRVDKRVTTGPEIGLTGLGCFTVTKPFMLSILSVVFTYEIVLLQCDPGTTPPPKKC